MYDKEYSHNWYLANKQKKLEQQRQYLQDPKIKVKRNEYYRKQSKSPETRKRVNKYRKEQRLLNKSFAVENSLRARLHKALKAKGARKSIKTFELLGCTTQQLKQYLESQFKEGMTWDNYGYGSDKWNIDHIIPCASFTLTDPEQQKICFHYSNLQPLWQPDNFTKSNNLFSSSKESSHPK